MKRSSTRKKFIKNPIWKVTLGMSQSSNVIQALDIGSQHQYMTDWFRLHSIHKITISRHTHTHTHTYCSTHGQIFHGLLQLHHIATMSSQLYKPYSQIRLSNLQILTPILAIQLIVDKLILRTVSNIRKNSLQLKG